MEGIIGGLIGGALLAGLLSSLGLGSGLASALGSILTWALIGFAIFFIYRLLTRKKQEMRPRCSIKHNQFMPVQAIM